MLKNAYLPAKIGADTAENEQHFAEILPIGAQRGRGGRAGVLAEARRGGRLGDQKMHFSKMHFSKMHFLKMHFSKILQYLAGSFSAVSKRIFARKYAFDSIFQALQDLHTFAPLQSQKI